MENKSECGFSSTLEVYRGRLDQLPEQDRLKYNDAMYAAIHDYQRRHQKRTKSGRYPGPNPFGKLPETGSFRWEDPNATKSRLIYEPSYADKVWIEKWNNYVDQLEKGTYGNEDSERQKRLEAEQRAREAEWRQREAEQKAKEAQRAAKKTEQKEQMKTNLSSELTAGIFTLQSVQATQLQIAYTPSAADESPKAALRALKKQLRKTIVADGIDDIIIEDGNFKIITKNQTNAQEIQDFLSDIASQQPIAQVGFNP